MPRVGQWSQLYTQLLDTLRKNWENCNYTLALFLDIKEAFRNSKLESIHNELHPSGMLKSRIMTLSLGESSIKKTISRGRPQEVVLLLLLWLLVINVAQKRNNSSLLKTFFRGRHLQPDSEKDFFLGDG